MELSLRLKLVFIQLVSLVLSLIAQLPGPTSTPFHPPLLDGAGPFLLWWMQAVGFSLYLPRHSLPDL